MEAADLTPYKPPGTDNSALKPRTPISDQALWLSSRHLPDEDHGEASSPGGGSPTSGQHQGPDRVRGGNTYHPDGTVPR